MSSFSPEEGSTFDFNGQTYLCRKQPRRLWPCQHCQLSQDCTAEAQLSNIFPRCRASERPDKTDVVFFVVYPTDLPSKH